MSFGGVLFAVFAIVFVIAIIAAAIHENTPAGKEAEKKRNDAFLRSCGVDPNSDYGKMINAQANLMMIDKQMKDMQHRHETAQIITSAAIGSAIAGDAGAVIGAVTAKNKIDSQKKGY